MEPKYFNLRLPPWYYAAFYIAAALVAMATAWFFSGGMYTAGAVMLIVFIPLTALYWYMLIGAPSKAGVTVSAQGVVVEAPPYFTQALPVGEISDARVVELSDPNIAGAKKLTGGQVGVYKAGRFKLPGGQEAKFLCCRKQAVLLQASGETWYIAPRDLGSFVDALEELGVSVRQ
jgi:hypothetical protein